MASGTIFPSSSSRELLVKSPTITNLPITTPNVEQQFDLPTNVRKFTLKCRTGATIKLAFNAGESSTNFITIPPTCIMSEENFDLPISFYFQLDRNDVVEILTWQKL